MLSRNSCRAGAGSTPARLSCKSCLVGKGFACSALLFAKIASLFRKLKSAICLFPLCYADFIALLVFVHFSRNCRFYFGLNGFSLAVRFRLPPAFVGETLLKKGYPLHELARAAPFLRLLVCLLTKTLIYSIRALKPLSSYSLICNSPRTPPPISFLNATSANASAAADFSSNPFAAFSPVFRGRKRLRNRCQT